MTEARMTELAATYRAYIIHIQGCDAGCRSVDTACPEGEELRAAYRAADKGSGE
ncbi:hypothetical protein [Streptomyces nitrosporeus]|uniref:hypothetical protein n=1 Tax=Streptomyces nitrosporeus TaxID=28894 RepID=UPI00142ED9DA|nr:hypothetical protein [Streptomyces nitrosporeus]GGZ12918.1 hypothetical protein GCM10010327_49990 [Streptomyces nitrosporeus]